jgi:hypothetical protein
MNIWDDTKALDRMEAQRDIARAQGKRLSYDCFNLKCRGDTDRVYCSRGKLLGQSKDGTLLLVSVLRGMTSGACKDCKDFDGEYK